MTALTPYEFPVSKTILATLSDFHELALILKETLGHLGDGTRDRIPNLVKTLHHACIACDLVLAALSVGKCEY